jgi:hypothetical protein
VTRLFSVLAAVAALAVAAAPVASAGPSKARGAITYNGHAGLGANIQSEGTARGIVAGRYGDGKFAGVKDGTSNTVMTG